MKSSYSELRSRARFAVRRAAISTLFVALAMVGLSATTFAATGRDVTTGTTSESYHVLYLTSVVSQREASEIVTDLRNSLGRARIFFVPSRNAISMMSTEHDFELAQKIVTEMSGGPRVFRLTYTFTHPGGGHGVESRSVAVVVASGEQAVFHQGNRVPVVTGRDSTSTSKNDEQVQYLDVGLNLNASLRGPEDDLVLRTKVAESAVAPEKSGVWAKDPILRQTTLQSVSIVSVGRPLVLGSIEIPGTTKHEQIEVTVEPVQ